MKKLTIITVVLTSFIAANFNFGECSGSGIFEQDIQYYNGNYENATLVGTIPKGVQGLYIELQSDEDVDIRLYGENNDKIVHWPLGLLKGYKLENVLYKNSNVIYSGYNGTNGKKGHEFIEVPDTTPVEFTMRAFGYRAGKATVNYYWTGKDDCAVDDNGSKLFVQKIKKDTTGVVGSIPVGVKNLIINLKSDNDLDIQLYGEDGTALVSWKPKGLLSGSSLQTLDYNDMHIEWSGYNGVNGEQGHEYISVTPATTEGLVMKVFGYATGDANVTYSWGENNVSGWRTIYLNDAKLELFTRYSTEYNETLPEDTYSWIVSHGFENSLLQATEVDPRIVKNVQEILSGLSYEVSEEYANLIFAISTARRLYGVDSVQFKSNRFSNLVAPLTESEIEKNERIEHYADMTQDVITQNGWDLNQSISNMTTILDYLKENGTDSKLSKDVKSVAQYIHILNKRDGRVKPRSSNASAIEYINHLWTIQKKSIPSFIVKGTSIDSANIFPHTAPWPLLMPLAEMRPVDEMQWIWKRFKDETIEEKYRFRLYGNYRKPAEVIAPYIANTKYSQESTEYINYVGGVCGTMSQVGRATFISLGIPSMGTGQPKHACITRYCVTSDNQYMTSLEQTISTLYNTTPDWHFFEDDSFRMNSDKVSYGEYQMGLGLAMNKPLQNYLDSRTLVRMAKTKEGNEKKELLKKATDASIYNAEAMYDRFEAMGRDFASTKIIIDELLEKLPALADGYSEPKAPDEDLSGEDGNVSLDSSIVQYRDTVMAALVTQLFKDSYANQIPLSDEYKSWIKVINAKNFYDLMHYYSFEAFAYKMQDKKPRTYFKSLDADVERSSELKRQKKNIKFQEKIVEKEQLIIKKQIELADENTTDKRKETLQRQIDRLSDNIIALNTEIDKNNEISLLYQSYINGDGLSEMKKD